MRPLAVQLALALVASASPAVNAAEPDAQRSAWRWRRAVILPAGAEASFVALAVPAEVAAQGQGNLHDLRLVGPEGNEVPYVLDRVAGRESSRGFTGRLVDSRREPVGPAQEGRGRSVWVVDFEEARRFDTLLLEIPARDFAKRVRVEASPDRQAWSVLREGAGLFDAPWTAPARVHHTSLSFDPPAAARYLRLTMEDDRRSPPVGVIGVTAAEIRRAKGQEERRTAALEPLGGSPASRYRLDLPAHVPFEEIALETDDGLFARHVRLLEIGANGRQERTLAYGLLYRLRLKDSALAGESLSLRLMERPAEGTLVVEVDDGDSPPLRRLRAVVSGPVERLLFAGAPGPLTLYYGNEVTRAPLYDLEPLREALALSGELAAAALGAQAVNPLYQKAAPLPFTAARGASVEAHQWKALRRIRVADREDLWTVTLAPEDLPAARADLGDLRIVDEADRQVPYILEPAAVERWVALTVEKNGRSSRAPRRTLTRHRLLVTEAASRQPTALPLWGLELDVPEPFFDRPFRLLAPAGAEGRDERTLHAGRLARSVQALAQVPKPIVIPLDGSRRRKLLLEIDEGDNTPLSLRGARALVHVPRVTFKAAPGAYRLLLGNREAGAPRYDLASLRQEVLSYSAVEAAADGREGNPAYRRFAGDYFSDAPPTLLLWGTLLAAVAALLMLTAHVLRQPPRA
jgi:hypothetical protein